MRYAFADCTLDTDTRRLVRSGSEVAVEPQVFDLLLLLVENAGRMVPREELIEVIWQGRIVSDSAISARIAAARRAVGDDGKRQAVIRTIARRGLQLAAELRGEPDTPPDIPETPDFPAVLARPPVRYTRTDTGAHLAYSISGAGDPVLRSGFFATNLEAEWSIATVRAQIERISARHKLVRFDELGCGLSDRDVFEPDLDRKAEHIRAVADAAGLDRFALLSESGGNLAAVHFAARYPDRVSKLAIAGGYVDGRLRRGAADGPDAVRELIATGWGAPEISFGRAFLLTYCPEGPFEVVSELVEMMQHAVSRDVMLRQRDLVNGMTIAPLLERVACPTLIVHGARDGVHPLSEARKLAAGIPDAELVVLDTANHLPVLGHPTYDGYMDTLMAFLAR